MIQATIMITKPMTQKAIPGDLSIPWTGRNIISARPVSSSILAMATIMEMIDHDSQKFAEGHGDGVEDRLNGFDHAPGYHPGENERSDEADDRRLSSQGHRDQDQDDKKSINPVCSREFDHRPPP